MSVGTVQLRHGVVWNADDARRAEARIAELEAALLRAHDLYCGCISNPRARERGSCWAAKILKKETP